MFSLTPGTPGRRQQMPRTSKLDLDPCARRLAQQPHHARVFQCVHFENEMPAQAAMLMFDLAAYHFRQTLPQVDRRDQQLVEFDSSRIAGQIVEEGRRVRADFAVAGEQPHIGVEMRGRRVVIPRGQVQVTADLFAFAPHHQRYFRVDLHSGQTVHHMHALTFECARPFDVALFVEARLQLDDHRDLLSLPYGFQKRLHHRRIVSQTVKRHLNRQHPRIAGGQLQKIDHGLKGIEGMVQEHVFLPDCGKKIPYRRSRRSPGSVPETDGP